MSDVFIHYSEFEEHQPVSIIPESSLESSSAAASAIDSVEDPVFTNFFSVMLLNVYFLCFLVNTSAISMLSFTSYYMMMSVA